MGGYTYNLTSEELGYDEEEMAGAAPPPPAPEAAPPPPPQDTGYTYNLSAEELGYGGEAAAAPPPAAPVENGGYTYNLSAEELGYDAGAPTGDPNYLGGYDPKVERPVDEAPPPPEATKDIPPPRREGPGFLERLGTGITEAPRNIADAIGGLFQSNDPKPLPTAPRDQGADAQQAALQRQAAEERGSKIDRDSKGLDQSFREAIDRPQNVTDALGEKKDAVVNAIRGTDAGDVQNKAGEIAGGLQEFGGDVVQDPKGSLASAAAAGLSKVPETVERGLDYSKNIVSQDQAKTVVDELMTGQALPETSPGNIYYLEGPMRLAALNDPKVAQAMRDAYYQGYTREDGTYIEPGARAAYIAYYEPLDTGQKMKHDAYYDPALIPMSVATLGVAPLAEGVAKIPTIGKALGAGLKVGVEAADTVTSLGLNYGIPGAIKGVGAAGKATGLLKPSAAALEREAVEQGFEAAQQLQAGMLDSRTVLQEVPDDIAVSRNAWNTLNTTPQTNYRTPNDIPVTALVPGPGQQPLAADVIHPMTGEVQTAGSPRLEFAVGHQRRFTVEQGADGTTWYVKENLPNAPKYTFNQTGSPYSQTPGIPNRRITDTPMQDAILFAKEKTLEWQSRGTSDPVTFNWTAPAGRNTPNPGDPIRRPLTPDEHAVISEEAVRRALGEDRVGTRLTADERRSVSQYRSEVEREYRASMGELAGNSGGIAAMRGGAPGIDPYEIQAAANSLDTGDSRRLGQFIGERSPQGSERLVGEVFDGEGVAPGAINRQPSANSWQIQQGVANGWVMDMGRAKGVDPYLTSPNLDIFADSADSVVTESLIPALQHVRERMNRYGLDAVDARFTSHLGSDTVEAMFTDEFRPAITLAMDAKWFRELAANSATEWEWQRKVASLVDHETIHAMKSVNVFTDEEWAVLTQAADEWIAKANPADFPYMADEAKDVLKYRPDQQAEEKVARLFEAWSRGEEVLSRSLPKDLAQQTLEILRAALDRLFNIGRAIEQNPEAEDILKQIRDGGFADRTRREMHAEHMLPGDPATSRYAERGYGYDYHPNSMLPPEAVSAFRILADDQRGAPEQLMLELQRTAGGGIFGHLAEHVGDLTNRMAQPMQSNGPNPEFGREMVRDKIEKALNALSNPYGYRREAEEQFLGNYKFWVKQGKIDPDATSFADFRQRITEAGQRYADAHRSLEVHNTAQQIARDAAVAHGEMRFDDEAMLLRQLKDMTEDPVRWQQEAGRWQGRKGGSPMFAQRGTPSVPMPVRYSRPLPYTAVRNQYTNKWEMLAQTVLPDETRNALDTEIFHKGLNRSVGDVLMEFRDEVDSLRRTAQGVKTSRSDGEIRSLEKRWNETYGEPRDWSKVSDEEADDLVAYATGQAIKDSHRLARGAKSTDVFAKLVRGVDTYLGYRRSMQLYGWAGGVQYITMQGVGNAITGMIAKPAALPYYFMNVSQLKKIKAWDQKTATVDQLPGLIRKWRNTGLFGNANVDTTFGTAIGVAGREGGPFNHPGASAFKRGIGKVLAPRWVANTANAFDLSWRMAAAEQTWDVGIAKLNKALPETALSTKAAHGTWSTLPVAGSDIENAIADLVRRHGNEFNGTQLRDALKPLGAGLARDRQAWDTYVDRVARDWTNGAKQAQNAARAEVDRVAFSFQNTNADEVLQRTFMYHYWMSRASVLYLQEAAKNPWQMRAWMQGMEEANRQQEDTAVPGWRSSFMKFMETPAGYSVAINPVSLLGTYFFFAEQGGEKPLNDYTALGKFLDDGPGGNIMLNPLITAAVYFLGAGGRDFSAGDIFGTRKWERKITESMNLANSLGGGFIRSQGGEPVPVPEIDSRKLFSWLGQYTSGRIPGTRQVDPFGDQSFARTALIYSISDQLVAGDPQLKARLESLDPMVADEAANQLEMATEEILLNPKHPYYQKAYADYAESSRLGPLSDKGPLGKIAGAAIREVSPFAISTSITEQDAARVRKKVTDTPTARDEQMGDLLWDRGDKRALNLAFEKAGANNWAGDFGVEALIAQRNPSMSTTEILQLAAEARKDPDSPLMQEARRLTDAEGVVRQITSGTWQQGTLKANGQEISQESLNNLDSSDRWKWANAWLADQGLLEAHESFRAQKQAFGESEPVLQGWYGYKDLAESYPGGFEVWVRDTARINPGFAEAVKNAEANGFLPGSPEFKDGIMKSGVYLKAEGSEQYGGRANGNGRYAGLPEGQSLASWQAEQKQEKQADGYGAKQAEGILKDMGDINAAYAAAEQYGEGDTFLMQLTTGDRSTYRLSSAAYNAAKTAAGGYLPSGKYSDVEQYVAWLRQQPPGTYQTEDEAVAAFVQQNRSASDPSEELPQTSSGGQATGGGGNLFQMWQGADPNAMPATHEAQMAGAAASGEQVLLSGADAAYLRPAPGRDAGFVTVMQQGQAMRMLELVDVGGEKWARVVLPNGQEGYVLAAYVRR